MLQSASSDSLLPLMRNCLFRSDQRVDAHEQVSRELIDHVLRWRQGMPDAAMHKAASPNIRMYLLQYGAEVEVTPQPFDDFVLVHTSLAGGTEVELDGQRIDVMQGRSALLAPKRKVRLRYFPGTRQLIVKVPHSLLRLLAITEGDASADANPIGFDPGFLLSREHGAQWDLIVRSLLNATAMPSAGPTIFHDAWLDHFERNVALFLASHQPAPVGHAGIGAPAALAQAEAQALHIDVTAQGDARRRVDALIDYIDSRLGAPIALEDLARAAGVGVRTLNEICRRQHGVTPMELLRHRRLDAARARLRMQHDASITETAFEFGFGHLGRFSQYYFERFGELPRQTQMQRTRG